ncbi:alpha-amylase family glycosyl hydrolase [Pedobacter nanyangensis]|uniref:alpha-amylase family glycosyl hydrolase n=1 Tax=Pedobacter nanyangensis TaxID=1562389 RepID=UPI000DE2AC37|nr:alpha-amylase family glycosyl hydrolase [Pedobacter nanyangensis]
MNTKFGFTLVFLVLLMISCIENQQLQPADKKDNIIIYQLLPRLFGNANITNKPFGTIAENGCGKFNDINDKAFDGLKELNVDYVWYTGIIAHASLTDYSQFGIATGDADVVKGRAGSPYAIRDYYDVDPDLAVDVNKRMQEFEALIKRTHDKGLKVLIDFVPNHVDRNYKSTAKPEGVEDFGAKDNKAVTYSATNDFYYLPSEDFVVPANSKSSGALATLQDGKFAESPAKATGNNVFAAQPSVNDWYETVKLNYGVEFRNGKEIKHLQPTPPVWLKMKDILVYWAKKGVDGFRCDVAEMVPVEFWSWVIPEVKKVNSKLIFIGEAYNPKAYAQYVNEGKFDYLYDKVGLYDGLKRFVKDEASANIKEIQHVWQTESKGFDNQMLRFLENHDEERIASKGFAGDAKLAFPAMVISATLGKGPLMLYFGQEVGEPGAAAEGFGGDDNRTTIFDYWGVPNHQRWLNGGKFDSAKLTVQEQQIREFYKKLTTIRATSDAVTNGAITEFPLTEFPKAYAYIRHSNKQRILVVANFSRTQNVETAINIPAQFIKKEGIAKAKELLSGNPIILEKNNITLKIAPSSAQIIQF